MPKIVSLGDKRKQKVTAKAEMPQRPWHEIILCEQCGIDIKTLTPRHFSILKAMADYNFEIGIRLNQATKGILGIQDVNLLITWYHWGMVRGKRRTSDLRTTEDCVVRMVKYGVRKIESVIAFKEKAKLHEAHIQAIKDREDAKKHEKANKPRLTAVK